MFDALCHRSPLVHIFLVEDDGGACAWPHRVNDVLLDASRPQRTTSIDEYIIARIQKVSLSPLKVIG